MDEDNLKIYKAMMEMALQCIQKSKKILVRADIFFYSLLWLMALLSIGTIAQRYIGLYTAQKLYFSCFIAWIGPLPMPGGYLVMSVIFINLLAKLLFDSPWELKRAGIIITHIGALLLLFGGFLTAAFSYEGYMVIPEGRSLDYVSEYDYRGPEFIDSSGRTESMPLPFSIELIDFKKKTHPGTLIAKSYSSEIRLVDGDMEWRSVISMNEPLRYKGLTFYQSSFLTDGETEATVLAVVKNAGRVFPYTASIIMCGGLLIQLILRMPGFMRKEG